MPDDSYALVLPVAAYVPTAGSALVRHYFRRLEAQRQRYELCTWEGEGGKLTPVAMSGRRSGGTAFANFRST
jgi:hypothetical protein